MAEVSKEKGLSQFQKDHQQAEICLEPPRWLKVIKKTLLSGKEVMMLVRNRKIQP